MLKVKCMMLVVALVFLSGCASTMTNEQMNAESAGFELPAVSSADDVVVYIGRFNDTGLNLGGDVAYRINGSDEFVGKLFKGEYFFFKLAPGKHEISWRGAGLEPETIHSNRAEISLESGKTYFFHHMYYSMFNQYAESGISISDNFSEVDPIKGKWLMSSKERSNASVECLLKKEVSIFRSLCK
ncbi:DUF2846 domain-containing protein [Vibrio vulnificus]|uniref:DUF2846 domain-containing protein n=1 Tax=Vibrio vulnificus TaxID=672 RepID=UPI001EEA968B|nr:DUF2846 domain-containing protein [Vibrio vulnificus]MCG6264866.1 DUF2846 domain-containing protein [Vibrio vulnificus]